VYVKRIEVEPGFASIVRNNPDHAMPIIVVPKLQADNILYVANLIGSETEGRVRREISRKLFDAFKGNREVLDKCFGLDLFL